MKLEYRNLPVFEVKVLDKKEGIVEAIVSVYNNIDAYNERIMHGCFNESLMEKMPKGVWMHNWREPVAKTLVAEECLPGDMRLPEKIKHLGGLYIKGQFNLDTQRGKEAFSDIAFGIVDEFSIGFSIITSTYNKDTGITDLIKGRLYEWSPVLYGANPATAVVSVKEAPTEEKTMNPYVDLPIVTESGYIWNEQQAKARIEAATDLKVNPSVGDRFLICDIVDGILCLVPDAVLAAMGSAALSVDIPAEVKQLLEDTAKHILSAIDDTDDDVSLIIPWNNHSFLGASPAILASFISEAKALRDRRASEQRPLSQKSLAKIHALMSNMEVLLNELREIANPAEPATDAKSSNTEVEMMARRLQLLQLEATL